MANLDGSAHHHGFGSSDSCIELSDALLASDSGLGVEGEMGLDTMVPGRLLVLSIGDAPF